MITLGNIDIIGLIIVAVIPFLFSLFMFKKVSTPNSVSSIKILEIAKKFFGNAVTKQLKKEADIIFAAANTDLGKVNFQSFYNSEPNEVTSQADRDFYNVFAEHKKRNSKRV